MDNNYVPSPNEVQRAVDRLRRITDVTFELELTTWRTIMLTDAHPMFNRVKPELSIIYYRPVLLIPTTYMPSIEAWLAVSLASLTGRGTATFIPIGSQVGRTVGFRPSNDNAEAWLRLQFARAQGMRFRSHGIVKPDAIVYTKEA